MVSLVKFGNVVLIVIMLMTDVQATICGADGCVSRRHLHDESLTFDFCVDINKDECLTTKKKMSLIAPKVLDVDVINGWANDITHWACCKLLTSTPHDVRTFIFQWQEMCYKNSRLLKNGVFDDNLNHEYNEIINFCPDSFVSTEHNYGSLENVIERNFNHDSEIICDIIPKQNNEDEYGSFTILYSENYTGMGIGHMVGIFNENTDLHHDNFINWHLDMSADKAGCRAEHNFENDVIDQYTFFRGGLGKVYSLADYQNQGSFTIDTGYTFNNINVTKMKKIWSNFQQENGYDLIQSNCAHAVWEALFDGMEHCHLTEGIASDFMWPRKTMNLVGKLAETSNQGNKLSAFDVRIINQWLKL